MTINDRQPITNGHKFKSLSDILSWQAHKSNWIEFSQMVNLICFGFDLPQKNRGDITEPLNVKDVHVAHIIATSQYALHISYRSCL